MCVCVHVRAYVRVLYVCVCACASVCEVDLCTTACTYPDRGVSTHPNCTISTISRTSNACPLRRMLCYMFDIYMQQCSHQAYAVGCMHLLCRVISSL